MKFVNMEDMKRFLIKQYLLLRKVFMILFIKYDNIISMLQNT